MSEPAELTEAEVMALEVACGWMRNRNVEEVVLQVLAARLAARDAEWQKAIERLAADPDDTQWWEVVPYMDPPDRDEVVEVQVIAVDRLRALVREVTGDVSMSLTKGQADE